MRLHYYMLFQQEDNKYFSAILEVFVTNIKTNIHFYDLT